MSNMSLPGLLLTGFIAALFVGCSGSGEGTQPVGGTVTYVDGAPVAGGTILFIDADRNSSSVGYIQQDGTYRLGTFEETDGAPQGKYRVTILGDSEYGQSSPIASQYGDREKSPLEAEVTRGKNTIDFQVEPAG